MMIGMSTIVQNAEGARRIEAVDMAKLVGDSVFCIMVLGFAINYWIRRKDRKGGSCAKETNTTT